MSPSCFSLRFFSQISLWKFSTFRVYKGIYSRVYEECEKSFFLQNIAFWQLTLMARTSNGFESQDNCQARLYILSCNAPAVVTLQLPACFTCVAFLASCQSQVTCEIQLRETSKCSHTWISSHFLTHNPYNIPT